jgi:hypothetical protein
MFDVSIPITWLNREYRYCASDCHLFTILFVDMTNVDER